MAMALFMGMKKIFTMRGRRRQNPYVGEIEKEKKWQQATKNGGVSDVVPPSSLNQPLDHSTTPPFLRLP